MAEALSTSSPAPALDGERAIYLGHPSYVWRAGQERRLRMVQEQVELRGALLLDVGCGLGMYTDAFRRYTRHVYGIEVERDRAGQAARRAAGVAQAVGEAIPFPADHFDVVFSHEVLEHVDDDRQVAAEMVRVTKRGGHVVVFAPNRLWPFETHGVYWRGAYHFGNIPLINYAPDLLRQRLAWHVRVYTRAGLLRLFHDLPVRMVHHCSVYPGFDNVVRRFGRAGRCLRAVSYWMEGLPLLKQFGLSHLLVIQKTSP